MNFNSIVNGTIDGRLEFSVSSGSVFVDRLDQVDVRLARPPDSFGFASAATRGLELCR